jgi:hypothetical protein
MKRSLVNMLVIVSVLAVGIVLTLGPSLPKDIRGQVPVSAVEMIIAAMAVFGEIDVGRYDIFTLLFKSGRRIDIRGAPI